MSRPTTTDPTMHVAMLLFDGYDLTNVGGPYEVVRTGDRLTGPGPAEATTAQLEHPWAPNSEDLLPAPAPAPGQVKRHTNGTALRELRP